MSRIRRYAIALFVALILTIGLGSVLAAPVAHAAVGSIIAPCNGLQDGQFRWYGRTLTECKHITGLGYYWVVVPTSCPAVAPARQPAVRIC